MLKKAASHFAATKALYPKPGPRSLIKRLSLLNSIIKYHEQLRPIIDAPDGSAMQKLYNERPDTIGALVWPYINSKWTVEERLRHIASHYEVLDRIGPPFPFSINERLVLADLSELHPELRLVLDQPRWFKREGGLTLNLFVDQFRAYSIAFSYHTQQDNSRAIYIGGIQGRNTEDSLELYKQITKAIHGIRPRDFLIHALQILAMSTDTTRIYAIADECRHHRHPFFPKKIFGGDYNEIWEQRGATRASPHFYQLPSEPERRCLDEIKSKKRSLYRKRYEFLDRFDQELASNLPTRKPVTFVDL